MVVGVEGPVVGVTGLVVGVTGVTGVSGVTGLVAGVEGPVAGVAGGSGGGRGRRGRRVLPAASEEIFRLILEDAAVGGDFRDGGRGVDVRVVLTRRLFLLAGPRTPGPGSRPPAQSSNAS